MAVVHVQNLSGTAVSGTFGVNVSIDHAVWKQVIIKSATASTTFDVALVDSYGNTVFDVESITGEINETVDIPTYGNMTATISSASADEAFTLFFSFIESL